MLILRIVERPIYKMKYFSLKTNTNNRRAYFWLENSDRICEDGCRELRKIPCASFSFMVCGVVVASKANIFSSFGIPQRYSILLRSFSGSVARVSLGVLDLRFSTHTDHQKLIFFTSAESSMMRARLFSP